jgi:hypothetical protein
MPKPRTVLLSVAVGLIALAIAGGALVTYVVWQKLEGRRVEQDSRTVVDAVRKVARLTTIEMNVSSFQSRRDSKNLLGFIPIRCEKMVAVSYRGRVAAGFDLQEGRALTVTTSVSPGGRRLRVELPPARLLYTDAPAPEVIIADGSFCNRFEPEDYDKLHADARAAMEAEALQKGILAQAEQHARELLTAVATALGYQVEIVVPSAWEPTLPAR